ncbi:MAG TPA: endonuclease III [Acidobacteriota bacterium]|nr:endonuclease III [Acidobacteriota bacterium]
MARKAKYNAEEQSRRVEQILRGLDKDYPSARVALDFTNPLELLVATILSAQCTDERVNIVTRDLFRKYRSAEEYVNARREALENDIRPTGFFRNKANSLQGACRLIVEKFGGRVPDTMEELLELPGVARKTANVVLGIAYGKAEGIVVDTHVRRVARRLELTQEADPKKIERDLMHLIPRDRWIAFSHQMIHHGRKVCKARKPLCPLCPLETVCRSKDKQLAFPASPRMPARRGQARGIRR